VAFGETQQIVDGLDPDFREGLFLDERREDGAKGLAEAQDLEENGVNSLWFGGEQGMKASSAFGGDDAGVDEEDDKLVPGEVVRSGSGIGEIESETPCD